MITLGIDAHKRTHTPSSRSTRWAAGWGVAPPVAPQRLTTRLIVWAGRFGAERTWAVEDCRHLSRRLERDMLAAGEGIVRVPPKLMAHARDAARTYGKSDPIDALAVARAALREPGLPTAHLDASSGEIRLLVDHRVDLVAERTRCMNRLRWHLHEIDPAWDPPQPAPLTTRKHLDAAEGRVRELGTVVARIAADLIARIRGLTAAIADLSAELDTRTAQVAPNLRSPDGGAARDAAATLCVGPCLQAQAWFVGGDTTGAIATGENSKDCKCYVDGEPDGESDGEHGIRVSATAHPRNRDQTKASRSSEGWNPVGQRRDPANMVAMARSASVIRDRLGDCRGAVDCRELRHGLLVVVVIPYTCGGHPQVCWLHEDFTTVKFRFITDLLVKSVP